MSEVVRLPPLAGETIATISSYPELVEAFRTIKARLGLSNVWCDETCDFADGVTDKLLGPTQAKSIGPLAFSMFCQIFAVKFTMQVDIEAVRKMEAHWEQREAGKVAFPESRMSIKLLERAKPIICRENGRKGGLKAHASGAAKRACRKGGKMCMRKMSKKERAAFARLAAEARWSRTRMQSTSD